MRFHIRNLWVKKCCQKECFRTRKNCQRWWRGRIGHSPFFSPRDLIGPQHASARRALTLTQCSSHERNVALSRKKMVKQRGRLGCDISRFTVIDDYDICDGRQFCTQRKPESLSDVYGGTPKTYPEHFVAKAKRRTSVLSSSEQAGNRRRKGILRRHDYSSALMPEAAPLLALTGVEKTSGLTIS